MIWRNLELATRSLRRTPWFVAVATLSLAFGCGATVGGFALLNGLLLRDRAVPKPWQLANVVAQDADGHRQPFSYPAFRELERRQTVFSEVFALAETGARNVDGRGVLVLVAAAVVVGLPAALLSARLFGSLLFQLHANDPMALATAVAALIVISLIAALIPTRRATNVAHSLGSR